MKIIIMTDLEGVAGVLNAGDYIHAQSKYYEHACELATLEVSAAVEGALQAGATDILVADGHGPGAMKRSLLHPRAKLLTGRPWPSGYPWGCDGTFAAAMSIGQHAKSNTDGGHLAHTQSFKCEYEAVNDISLGETGQWMLIAGYFGVPVVMLSGDEAACEEARALVPNIEIAPVKCGVKRGSATGLTAEENEVFNSAAIHLSPDEARALIRDHAYRAVKRVPEIAPFRLDPPYSIKVALRPEQPGGEVVSAVVKSTDVLDLLMFGRVKAYRKCRDILKKGGKGRKKAATRTEKKRVQKAARQAAKKSVRKRTVKTAKAKKAAAAPRKKAGRKKS